MKSTESYHHNVILPVAPSAPGNWVLTGASTLTLRSLAGRVTIHSQNQLQTFVECPRVIHDQVMLHSWSSTPPMDGCVASFNVWATRGEAGGQRLDGSGELAASGRSAGSWVSWWSP